MTVIPDTELLWRELRDRLRAFIARRVDNPADVEDLLQEVFLRIHQHLSTVKDTGRLTSWIFQLTRNAITDYYRAAARRHEIPGQVTRDDELGKEEGAAAPLLHSDEPATFNDELVPCLTPLLERLPEHYREALQLVEIEGLAQRELSERLTVSLSGAKSRVQRGREKLKDLLLRCCQVELDKRGNVMDYRSEAGRCGREGSATTLSRARTNSAACPCTQPNEERHERSIV
jgi:RNA polymerase sigma-70 factor (ECF subfamily)